MQDLHQEICTYEETVEHVEKTGDALLNTMNLGPERDILKYKVADMSRRYANVKDKATERKDTLDQLAPLVERYPNAVEGFSEFLDDSEEKLDSLKVVPTDEEAATKLKAEIKVSHMSVT